MGKGVSMPARVSAETMPVGTPRWEKELVLIVVVLSGDGVHHVVTGEAWLGASTSSDAIVRRKKIVNHWCGEGAFYDAGNKVLFAGLTSVVD